MKHLFAVVLSLVLLPGLHAQTALHTNVLFDFGKYNLKTEAKTELDNLVDKIPSRTTSEVYVYGHTDWIGGQDYNLWLGNRRAEQVKQYLENKGVRTTVVTQSFGKNKPAATNKTDNGRHKNRRVEVELCISPIPVKTDMQIATINNEITTTKKDTTEIFEQGSRIHLTPDVVAPYDLKDVKLEVKEIFTPEDMIENKATTQDKEGNNLISGGMVLIKATVNGKEIQAGGSYTITLPVEDYAIDTEMQVYTSVNKGGHLVWKLTKIPLKIVNIDGKSFYQFTVNCFGGFNCDKYRLSNYLFKIKAQKYTIEEAYIVDKKIKSLFYTDNIHGRRADFKYRSIDITHFRLIVSAKRGGKYYFASVTVSALEKPLFSSRYLVEKDLFREVSKKQLDKLLAGR